MINVIGLNDGINLIHLDIEEDFLLSQNNEVFEVNGVVFDSISVLSIRIAITDKYAYYELTGYHKDDDKLFYYPLNTDIEYLVAIQKDNGKHIQLMFKEEGVTI